MQGNISKELLKKKKLKKLFTIGLEIEHYSFQTRLVDSLCRDSLSQQLNRESAQYQIVHKLGLLNVFINKDYNTLPIISGIIPPYLKEKHDPSCLCVIKHNNQVIIGVYFDSICNTTNLEFKSENRGIVNFNEAFSNVKSVNQVLSIQAKAVKSFKAAYEFFSQNPEQNQDYKVGAIAYHFTKYFVEVETELRQKLLNTTLEDTRWELFADHKAKNHTSVHATNSFMIPITNKDIKITDPNKLKYCKYVNKLKDSSSSAAPEFATILSHTKDDLVESPLAQSVRNKYPLNIKQPIDIVKLQDTNDYYIKLYLDGKVLLPIYNEVQYVKFFITNCSTVLVFINKLNKLEKLKDDYLNKITLLNKTIVDLEILLHHRTSHEFKLPFTEDVYNKLNILRSAGKLPQQNIESEKHFKLFPSIEQHLLDVIKCGYVHCILTECRTISGSDSIYNTTTHLRKIKSLITNFLSSDNTNIDIEIKDLNNFYDKSALKSASEALFEGDVILVGNACDSSA